MAPIHQNHPDEEVVMTVDDCQKAHSERNKFTMWLVGLILTVMLALAGTAWAYLSDAIKHGAEHEIRIQHLEETAKKIDRIDDKMTDMRRILEEINRKK
jgi:hypothetical protein